MKNEIFLNSKRIEIKHWLEARVRHVNNNKKENGKPLKSNDQEMI